MNVIRIFLCFAVLIASIVSVNETLPLKTDTLFEGGGSVGAWVSQNNHSSSDDFDDSLFSLDLLENINVGVVAFFYFTPISTHPTDTAYVIRAPPIFSS